MTLGIPEWWPGLERGKEGRVEGGNKMDAGMWGSGKAEGQTEGESEIN